jgi:hypothetical protein
MDSSGYQSLWTTITSTIAAIASAAAAILTWRQHRRGQRANDPVVELDAHWSSGKTFTGSDGMIMLQFRLRNYSTQSIVFKRIRVYRPKRSTIGRTISQNGRVTVTKSSSGEAPLRWDIGVQGDAAQDHPAASQNRHRGD